MTGCLFLWKKVMSKQNEQMPVRYRQLASGQGTDFYFERSLDLIFSPGTFTVEIDHTSADVGLPVGYCGAEHYIVGTLIVTDSGTSLPMQTNRTIGQILIITSCKNKETSVHSRTFANCDWSEWRSFVYAGMFDNITTTDELISTVSAIINDNKELLAGIKTETTRATLFETNLQYRDINIDYTGDDADSVLKDALKLLRIETDNPDVNAVDFRVTTLLKNYSNPIFRFGLGTSLGANLWVASNENIFDGNVHSQNFTLTINGVKFNYTLYFQIDGSAIEKVGIVISHSYDVSPYVVSRNAIEYIGDVTRLRADADVLLATPYWIDCKDSTFVGNNLEFLAKAGNLIIEGFDKGYRLGIWSLTKGHTTYGSRIGLFWEKDNVWVKGDALTGVDFSKPFKYTIDGVSYSVFIDLSLLEDSDTVWVSDTKNVPNLKTNNRYLTTPLSDIVALQTEIDKINENLVDIKTDINGTGGLNFLKNPDEAYTNQEKLIISAIKNIGFYNVPNGIKGDEIFVRAFFAQSTVGNGTFGQQIYFANKRIYNETKDWNKASILITPTNVCDYKEHEFDVIVSTGEMTGMRIRVLIDYSVFAGQEFNYYTNINNKIVFNLERTWRESIQDRFDRIEEQVEGVAAIDSYNFPMEQRNVVWLGSSNVWGDGFLDYSYLKAPLEWLYKSTGTFTPAEDAVVENGEVVADNKKLLGNAVRVVGIGSTISFKHRGSELNICQVIERSSEYAVIGLYDGDTKVAEFTNHNKTIGSDNTSFTGNGSQTKFNLDRCFTYNHRLTVNGIEKSIALNTFGYGASFPDGVDCLVIRAVDAEKAKVVHSLWFKDAPANGAVINVEYDYGETISFVKSTVGETSDGVNESPYGDGTISYDPNNPATIGAGLDYRLVNEKAFFKYWFDDDAERNITLKIERGSANPYFTFNFASSVYHNVMNAGIGGYTAAKFNTTTNNPLTSWVNIADYFTPDFVSIGLTGNDDWQNFPRKINRVVNMTLEELRDYPSLEIGKIEYIASSDTYDVTLNSGTITEITARSLKSPSIIGSEVAVGDFVRIGTYTGDLRQVQTRRVESVDIVNGIVTWAEPLHLNEFICLDSLQDLVGQDVSIRGIEQYMTNMKQLIENILSINPKCKVCLFNIYYVDMWMRDTAEYTYIQQWIANEFPANVFVVDAWKYSRDYVECSKKSRTINVTADGGNEIAFASPSTFGHWEGIEVWVGDRNVYGTDCYAVTGYKYTVDQSKSGTALNWEGTSAYLRPHTEHGKMKINWKKNIPASGTSVTIKLAYNQWSADWGHPYDADFIDNSLGRAMIYALKR